MARILIVDDDFDIKLMLAKHLELMGHTPILASNGWEALIAMEHRPIDLILLDVMMPGMDGPTFLRILQESSQDHLLPVLVISALGESEAKNRFAGLRVAGILPKTQKLLDELFASIDHLLKSYSAVTSES